MSGNSITSANSTIMLAVATIFPVSQKLQGYTAEDIFDTDDVDLAEVVLGLDKKQSAGWVPHNVKQRFTIMPNSDSILIFDTWITAQDTLMDIYLASAVVALPSVGKKFSCSNGVLTRGKIAPDAKKTLQPQTFEITWESVLPAPM